MRRYVSDRLLILYCDCANYDDKFLTLAINGEADPILSGDEDLRAIGRVGSALVESLLENKGKW